MYLRILADILEMLVNGLGNADLTDGDIQCLHQLQSIAIGTVCGSETWHRDTNDTLAVDAKLIEGFHRDKQG